MPTCWTADISSAMLWARRCGWSGAMLDVTVRSQLEAQFRAVFEGANIGIVQFDPRSVLALRVNAKLCEIWGAPESEIVGRSLAQWTPAEDADARDDLHRRLATGETLQDRFEKRYRRRDGRIIWARVNLVSQTLGDAVHAMAMIEDITEEKRADARREALISLGDRLRELRLERRCRGHDGGDPGPRPRGDAGRLRHGRPSGGAGDGGACPGPRTDRLFRAGPCGSRNFPPVSPACGAARSSRWTISRPPPTSIAMRNSTSRRVCRR